MGQILKNILKYKKELFVYGLTILGVILFLALIISGSRKLFYYWYIPAAEIVSFILWNFLERKK